MKTTAQLESIFSLFNVDSLRQDVVFPLDIVATFLNNLSRYIRECGVLEIVQLPISSPAETNNQWNQRLDLVMNSSVEAVKIS